VKRGDGSFWVPGIVVGQKINGKTAPDYKIQLPHETLDGVSASRIRRHFGPGGTVEMYRGSAEGWVPAMIKEQVGKVEYPAPLSQNSPHPPEREESPVLDAPHAWVNVLIVEQMQHGSPAPEYVPLWLLRQPTAKPDQYDNNGATSWLGAASWLVSRRNGSDTLGTEEESVGIAGSSQWAQRTATTQRRVFQS